MALVFGAQTNGGAGGGSVNTEVFSHTISAGTNKMLLVCVSSEDSTATDRDVVSVTLSSTTTSAMTRAINPVITGSCEIEWWYLLEPPAGVHEVVIVWAGIPSSGGGTAIHYLNVDQLAPTPTASNIASSTDTINQTITTTALNQVIFTGINHNVDTVTFTNDGSQVERSDFDAGLHRQATSTLDATTISEYTVGAVASASATSLAMAIICISPSTDTTKISTMALMGVGT